MEGKDNGTGPVSCVRDRTESAMLAFGVSGE
jgi:hypothetical protein